MIERSVRRRPVRQRLMPAPLRSFVGVVTCVGGLMLAKLMIKVFLEMVGLDLATVFREPYSLKGFGHNIISEGFMLIMTIVAIIGITKLYNKQDLSSIGFKYNKYTNREFIVGVLFALLMIVLYMIPSLLLKGVEITGISLITRGFSKVSQDVLIGLLVTVAMAILSEGLYRGYFIETMEQSISSFTAIITGATLYALVQSFSLFGIHDLGWHSFIYILNAFLFAVLMSELYLMKRTVWLPMAFHITYKFGMVYWFGLGKLTNEGATLVDMHYGKLPLLAGTELLQIGTNGGLIMTTLILVSIIVVSQLIPERQIKI